MKSNRFLCWCLGAGLAVSLSPTISFAQAAAATGGTAAAAGGTTTIGTGGVTGSTATGTTTTTANAAKAVKSITASAGSGTSIPSSGNVFSQTYVNPLSLGLPANWNQFGIPTKQPATFGKVLYTASTATNAKGAGGANANQQGANDFTTYGIPRTPPFSTILDPEILPAPRTEPRLQSELRGALERSIALANQKNIQLVINGATVELRGQVGSEKELRAVEGIVGLSPGVDMVINQLQVVPGLKETVAASR